MVLGGFTTYGAVAGVIMLDSRIPRIPGDPGHAQTFPFPVLHEIALGLPFGDLVEGRFDRVTAAIDAARRLEARGVAFVAADCGLFSLYQDRVAQELSIPFIGSSLRLVPLLSAFLPPRLSVGILTGHAGMLSSLHLTPAGIDPQAVFLRGLEGGPEFRRVVIERGLELDPEVLAGEVGAAASSLAEDARAAGRPLGAVVIECTNLISFREEIQERAGAPVYDLVSLIELYASGYERRVFPERYRSFRRG